MSTSWVQQWQHSRIFVLGDVMLDKFVYGRVERVSPEAPIPVLHFQSETVMLGGAGNVARNIVALGGVVVLAGLLGDDSEGDLVADKLCPAEGIEGRFVRLAHYPTTVKIRYVSGGQQIMRLDVERPPQLDGLSVDAICSHFADVADSTDAVVLSDYAKGALPPAIIRNIIDRARACKIPIVVDPKSRDVRRYAGATVLTPNAAEAALVADVDCAEDAKAEAAVRIIRDLAGVDAVALTRGAQGMTIWDPNEVGSRVVHIPCDAIEVFDVSGAGDTVVAALSLALASGASVTMAARVANVAAGVAVGKRGTAVVRARELTKALSAPREISDPKIVGAAGAAKVVADWKRHGFKIGFTNGCFELLHPGHIELLKRARAACDRLVVALNADDSVKRLKGDGRPVQNEHARSFVMAALDCVDLVTIFEEATPMRLIETLQPDVLIKGADYTLASVVGAEFVMSYGGKVVLVPLEVGQSTTSIIARANAASEQ